MTSAFSWQNSISFCPVSFCIPRPNLPVTPGVSWLPTFAFQSPIMKGHLFWVLVLKGLVGLDRTFQLQLLQCYWLGHRLGLVWYWMVYLGNKPRSFCHFWDCIQVLHLKLFCWPWWLLHFYVLIWRIWKHQFENIYAPLYSLLHYLQLSRYGNKMPVTDGRMNK